jgi:thioredoxin reductase
VPRLGRGFATSVPGLFLAGDLTAGQRGGSIILAFNTAAAAMRQIREDHGIGARESSSSRGKRLPPS